MRGWSLRAALTVWTLALLATVVVALVAVAARQTVRLARSEALARAERIASRSLDGVARGLHGLEGEARLLAERPTLARAIAADDGAALTEFLDRYRSTAGFAGIALVCATSRVVSGAAAGDLPESRLEISGGELRARAVVPGPAGCRIEVADAIDDSGEASAATGLEIRLRTRAEVDAAVGGERIAI
ncbi:MAG: hypothetical protein KDB94_12615, partial [Acidobacteria bacterium]|nr:hypothetical protein [Acidobacteriota bacterium]